jgi:hypothetical protein
VHLRERAVADWNGHLEAACDTLIASLAERYEDDVTVLLTAYPVKPTTSRDSG